ncbi:rhomboid family intramembrane serine protease [Planctomycetota bacterium]
MILPIRTSIRPWRTPYANYALIIVNVIIFLLSYGPHYSTIAGYRILEPLRPWAQQFMLNPQEPTSLQFISYAFLHGGFMHIIGNMYFLYLFGNNVNDKLGSLGYILFYLSGAVFSAAGHIAIDSLYGSAVVSAPLLGASGAVAAVIGAYLALFPQTLITIVYWFFFIGTMELPAFYFIIFKLIVIDNVIVRYTPNVAYDAHLAGYAFGVVALLIMLGTGLVTGTRLDLWAMLKQWNRRRQYRDVISSGHDPFTGRAKAGKIRAKEVKTEAQSRKIQELRTEIAERITQRNLSEAARLYLELIETDKDQILPRQYLLDIANQLAGENKHAESAQAYEKFLAHYRNYEHAEQVELMLGILYSRYLQKPQLAVKHLQAAEKKLSDPEQLKMCREEIAKLQD